VALDAEPPTVLPSESVFTARIELRVPLLPERDATAPAVTPPSAFENLPRFAEASASLIVPKVRTETAIAEMRMPYLLAEFMIYPFGDKTLGEKRCTHIACRAVSKKDTSKMACFHAQTLRVTTNQRHETFSRSL
jgi:hypothetical protein